MNAAAAVAISTGSISSPIHAFCRDLKPQIVSHTVPTIFIVDDNLCTRNSLELRISSQGWQPQTSQSAREFLARPRALVPGVLILAFSSMHKDSIEVQLRIAREWPQLPIIVVADYEDISTAVQAMKAGAADFLVRPFSDEQLLEAIRHSFVRSRAAFDRWKEMRDLRNCHGSLSPREQQVMALVVSGLLNKQVGGELGISEITVKAHHGQVMQKMKAASFAHLVNMALKLHITRPIALNIC